MDLNRDNVRQLLKNLINTKYETDRMEMVPNDFQVKIKSDNKAIKRSNKFIAPADKSVNMYKMEKNTYERHLSDNISATYKKSNKSKIKSFNERSYQRK